MSSRRPWTDDELRILRERFPAEGGAEVARALGRSKGSVYTKAGTLGLQRIGRPKRRFWTSTEDGVLRRDYARRGAHAVARQLNRTVEGVRQRAQFLHVRGRLPSDPPESAMSDEQIDAAEVLYARGMTYQDIGKELGVSARKVASHILPEVRDHYRRSLTKNLKRRLARGTRHPDPAPVSP